MIVYYCEMPDSFDKSIPRYLKWNCRNDFAATPPIPNLLLHYANRIWKLDSATKLVVWAKNRQLGIMAPIDKGEFLLAQLGAVKYTTDMRFNFYQMGKL